MEGLFQHPVSVKTRSRLPVIHNRPEMLNRRYIDADISTQAQKTGGKATRFLYDKTREL